MPQLSRAHGGRGPHELQTLSDLTSVSVEQRRICRLGASSITTQMASVEQSPPANDPGRRTTQAVHYTVSATAASPPSVRSSSSGARSLVRSAPFALSSPSGATTPARRWRHLRHPATIAPPRPSQSRPFSVKNAMTWHQSSLRSVLLPGRTVANR